MSFTETPRNKGNNTTGKITGLITVRVRQCSVKGKQNHGKSQTPKFVGEDIRIGFRSTNELLHYRCRYSLDLALVYKDRFFYIYESIINLKHGIENIEPEGLERYLQR